VGAVAGALTVGARRQLPLAGIFAIAAVSLGGLVCLSAVRHFWTAVARFLFITGFFGIMVMASGNARLQAETPGELRGRVMGLYVLLTGGVFPIGAFIVGAISERWGVVDGRSSAMARRAIALAAISSPRSAGGRSRMLKKAHLLRWRPRPTLNVERLRPRVRAVGPRLASGPFEHPAAFQHTSIHRRSPGGPGAGLLEGARGLEHGEVGQGRPTI